MTLIYICNNFLVPKLWVKPRWWYSRLESEKNIYVTILGVTFIFSKVNTNLSEKTIRIFCEKQ